MFERLGREMTPILLKVGSGRMDYRDSTPAAFRA
jgi:hypothetical protein